MYTQQRVLKGDSLAEAHSHTSTHALFPQQQLFVQTMSGLCINGVQMPSLAFA